MPANSGQHAPQHLNYLDSARGIAAFMVMGTHIIYWQFGGELSHRLFGLLFNGDGAVSFFFVLSGFVLSYKYIARSQSLDIRKFYVNRVFRLWPAFFVAIVLCYLEVLSRSGINMHSLADEFVRDKNSFWEEAILLWSRQKLYGPGWTLVQELKVSLFLPFIIALAKRDIRYIYWMLLTFYLMDAWVIFLFTGGALISCLFSNIANESFKQTKWHKYRYLLLPVAVLFFSLNPINYISPLGPDLMYFLNYIEINFYHFSGIAAFVFIVAIINSANARKVLSSKPLLFIGKISYGIYLMHWVIMSIAFLNRDAILKHFNSPAVALLVVFIVYVICSIVLATIVHYAIELPFIKIGKRITGKMKPSLQVPA